MPSLGLTGESCADKNVGVGIPLVGDFSRSARRRPELNGNLHSVLSLRSTAMRISRASCRRAGAESSRPVPESYV